MGAIKLRNGSPIELGGRYIQNSNALEIVGKEVKTLGKKAFIIGGQTALEVSFDTIKKSLDYEDIIYKVHVFKGFCSMTQINHLGEEATKFGADVIIGIGGGRALDTAKGVAHIIDKRIVTVPTTAAQCASYAIMSVIYSDDGESLSNMHHDHEIDAIIVDTNIITQKCPARMLASGIGDSMAKYPEIAFSIKFCSDLEKSILPTIAMNIAKFNWDVNMLKGKKTVDDVKKKLNSKEVEDIICANIALTGMTSSLTSGGKQLAIAHSFYDSICMYFKEQQTKFLHGELVALGVSLQMKVNGCSDDEIKQYKNFSQSLGLPITLKDIQLDASEKNLTCIHKYIVNTMGLDDKKMHALIWNSMNSIV